MYFAMDGTKHEKVVLVVLAYIIGFTAGFICFSITASGGAPSVAVATENHTAPNERHQADSSVQPGQDLSAPEAEVISGMATATYENGKLKAFVDTKEYLLSFNTSVVDITGPDDFKNQGSHADIPAFVVAPEGRFIYYCEQQSADDTCNNLLYDVAENAIRKVTVAGEASVSSAHDAKSAIWSNGALVIGNYISQTPTEPWILQTK